MSEIVVRAAEPSDLDAIHAILSHPSVQPQTLQLPFRSVDGRREWLSRMLSDGSVLVAEIDGRVVGNIGLHVPNNARRRHAGSFGMSVHGDYHGRGVGSALLRAMLDLADNWLGLRRVELEVFADNAAAVHLYQKFGFEIEGTGRQWARRDGELVDIYYMARLKP